MTVRVQARFRERQSADILSRDGVGRVKNNNDQAATNFNPVHGTQPRALSAVRIGSDQTPCSAEST